jgi:hypothetical protein
VRDSRATPTLPPGCFLLLISPPPRLLPHGEEPRAARRLKPWPRAPGASNCAAGAVVPST